MCGVGKRVHLGVLIKFVTHVFSLCILFVMSLQNRCVFEQAFFLLWFIVFFGWVIFSPEIFLMSMCHL